MLQPRPPRRGMPGQCLETPKKPPGWPGYGLDAEGTATAVIIRCDGTKDHAVAALAILPTS
jgi:hypothetical protein